jgi:hypothetical protein
MPHSSWQLGMVVQMFQATELQLGKQQVVFGHYLVGLAGALKILL